MGLLEDIQADNLRREGKKNFSDTYHPDLVQKSPPKPSPTPNDYDLATTATNFFNAMSRRKAKLDSPAK